MTYQTQQILEKIKDILSALEKDLDYDNSAQNYDSNKYAEDFYVGLLNIIFPEWNLVNLNTLQANYPAIDLGGTNVGIQITTETSKTKIEETLSTFGYHNLNVHYSTIYILMIKGKKIPNTKIKNESKISFEKNKHIWDNQDILTRIRNNDFNIQQLNKILLYISSYIKKKPSLYRKVLLPIIHQSKSINIYDGQNINVLHLGDFNIKQSDIEESPSDYHEFLKTIDKFPTKIDLIIFNGNLIYDNVDILHDAYQKFLLPILNKLNLTEESLFICPGIHELDKRKFQEWRENAINNSINSELETSAIISQSKEQNDALPKLNAFFDFSTSLFKDVKSPKSISIFDSNFIFNHSSGKFNIGISSLNNVWTYSIFHPNNPIFGSEQLSNAIAFVDETNFKIGLAYFPPDILKSTDADTSKKLLESYNAMFFSNHEQTKYKTGFFGNTFFSILHKDSSRFIGQILEFSNEQQNVVITKLNSIDEDKKTINFPTTVDIKISEQNENIIRRLEQNEIEDINKHLIYYGASTCAPSNICDIFVLPKITDTLYENTDDPLEGEEKQKIYNLQEIIFSGSSYVIFGRKEVGKSLLLDKIFVDIVRSYHTYKTFPVLINLGEISNLDIVSEVRKFLGITKADAVSKLSKGEIVILIDDLTFEEHDIYKLKNINYFKKEYPHIKIVATSKQTSELDIPWEQNDLLSNCNFQPLFIRTFGSKKIKDLAKKWFNGNKNFDTDEAIDKVIKSFFSFSLPSTPLSASLFFWIIETQEKRQINNSTLIEAFVDKLLESKNQIYRDSFDIKNKKYLLADIAKLMFDNNSDNYAIEYGTLINQIDEYLVDKRFNSQRNKVFHSEKLLNNFIERGIFIKHDNRVKFRFPCFFHFFLGLKMHFDKFFKAFVLNEENYLDFTDEIDYYTGLVRNDEETLEILHERLNLAFRNLKQTITPNVIDDFFKENTSVIKTIDLPKMLENAPTEKDIEKFQDESLDLVSSEKQIKAKQKNVKRVDRLIMLTANVLRNTEETTREKGYLKELVYKEIVSDMVIHMCVHKMYLVNYYQKHKSVPHFLPWKIEIKPLLKILPLIYQITFYDWVGSLKLSGVISDKIISDHENKNVSKLEEFMSVFCLSDMKSSNSKLILKKYIYNETLNNTIIDLSFFKIMTYFYLRSKNTPESENYYIDLLTELKLKNEIHRKKELKEWIKKKLIHIKKKNLSLLDEE